MTEERDGSRRGMSPDIDRATPRRHRPYPPRHLAVDVQRKEQIERLNQRIAELEEEAPPANSVRGKILDALRTKRAELRG
jgi:hypothetical protein